MANQKCGPRFAMADLFWLENEDTVIEGISTHENIKETTNNSKL